MGPTPKIYNVYFMSDFFIFFIYFLFLLTFQCYRVKKVLVYHIQITNIKTKKENDRECFIFNQ